MKHLRTLLAASMILSVVPLAKGVGVGDQVHALLHRNAQPPRQDPIGAIEDEMGGIKNDLQQLKTDDIVQLQQKQVVSQLDTLIEQLNQQCNGNGGMSNNPTKPMQDSKITKGPGGSGPMHDPQAGTKQWGQLPPKERDKILQSENDGFPAGYESILSSYYSRLAQEQVAGGATGSATPASATPGSATPSTQPAANQ